MPGPRQGENVKFHHKNRWGIILGTVFSALSLSLLPACGGNNTPPVPQNNEPGPCDQELQEGKNFLMQGDYFQAQDRYFQCVEKYPDNVTEFSTAVADQQKMTSEYGYVLSRILLTVAQVSTTMEGLVSSAGGLLSGVLTPAQIPAPSLNIIVSDLVYGTILKEADDLRPYLADLKTLTIAPSFVINDPETEATESIPVYLGKNNEVLWLSLTGELDRSEIEIIDSFLEITQGLSETLLSINWDVDLNKVINAALDIVLGLVSGTPIPLGNNFYIGSPFPVDSALVPLVASIAGYTLNNSPSFLTLNKSSLLPMGGGKDLLLDAASKLGEGSGAFLAAFDGIRAEGDDPSDPFAIVNKDGKENFRLTFLDPTGTQKAIYIPTRAEFFTAIQNVKNSIEANGGARVSWAGDLSWLISYGAAFLLQTGGVTAFLDISLAKISPSLSGQLKSFLQSLPLAPDLVQSALISIIGDVIQLDLGYFYRNPKDRYIRGVIPYWTSINSKGDGYLILEYECPIPTQGSTSNTYPLGNTAYTCPAETITDRGHFQRLAPGENQVAEGLFRKIDPNEKPGETANLPVYISPDELLGQIPYIAWQDPTLNHLLWVNLGNLGCNSSNCPSGFVEPGLWEFNYFTIKLLGGLMSVIQSLVGST